MLSTGMANKMSGGVLVYTWSGLAAIRRRAACKRASAQLRGLCGAGSLTKAPGLRGTALAPPCPVGPTGAPGLAAGAPASGEVGLLLGVNKPQLASNKHKADAAKPRSQGENVSTQGTVNLLGQVM